VWTDGVSLEFAAVCMISKTGFDPAFGYSQVISSQQMSFLRRYVLLKGIVVSRV
jgi:hypothetical protein